MAEEQRQPQVRLHPVATRLADHSATPGRYLFGLLVADVAAGTVALPSPHPSVTLRVRHGIARAQNGRRIARLLAADPTLTAKALRAACANGRLRRPRTLPDVVARLGRSYATALASRAVDAELPGFPNLSIKTYASDAWQRSQRVSTISYLLATLDGRFDPEEAALAGLLHNLGEFALIGRAARENRPGIEGELERAVRHYAAEAGRELTRSWGFPISLQQVCNSFGDWYRDNDRQADLADLVLVAQLHARLGHRQAGRLPALGHMPAFAKLELGRATPSFSLQLLEAARNALALTRRQLAKV